jgi:MSHA biogenesis protein MshI
MKLPWQRASRKDKLVIAHRDDQFAYVHAEGARVLRCGVEARGDDDAAAFARRVRALGLPAAAVTAVLPLADCQLLQIEAPVVPVDELKAAARWKIKDMVDAHLGDLTIDVMHVGDGRQKASRQLFVAAASTLRVRELAAWSQAARLALAVIDLREMAQRNVQNALAAARGRSERASAALVVHGDRCLLTLCANDELFYARRLDWRSAWLETRSATLHAAPTERAMSDFAELDIVDYGAEDPAAGAAVDDVPPLVIELQRTLDVWERSWPDLALDRLVVHANGNTEALAALLAPALAVPVEPLDLETLFPGFHAAAGAPSVASTVAPLLGALLRQETRQP